jgi:hypothetical protein
MVRCLDSQTVVRMEQRAAVGRSVSLDHGVIHSSTTVEVFLSGSLVWVGVFCSLYWKQLYQSLLLFVAVAAVVVVVGITHHITINLFTYHESFFRTHSMDIAEISDDSLPDVGGPK